MKTLLQSLAIAASPRCCSAPAPSHAQAKDKVVLLLNWYSYSEHAPFFLGKERGYFDQEGIDLDIQEGRGSGVTVQAVAAGTATFGYADVPTMIKAAAKGAPVTAVGVALQTSPDVGDGLRRQEHPQARGHQRQDGRGDARRLDVAGLAAVPEEDRPQGIRFQDRLRRRADQAQRGDERPGGPAARLRDGPGDQAAGRDATSRSIRSASPTTAST